VDVPQLNIFAQPNQFIPRSITFPTSGKTKVSPEAQAFILMCLQNDPKERPILKLLLGTSYLKSFLE
jgi:hypothetical protein